MSSINPAASVGLEPIRIYWADGTEKFILPVIVRRPDQLKKIPQEYGVIFLCRNELLKYELLTSVEVQVPFN